MSYKKIGIVGATGAVGLEILKLLRERHFPFSSIRCFASLFSINKKIPFGKDELLVEELSSKSFQGLDLVFFCADTSVSIEYVQVARESGALVIDNSAAFRMDKDVPLIIPEVNPKALYKHKGLIANPNCATILMLMALAPLHKESKLKRIVVSTYQAASGAGKTAVEELKQETLALLKGEPFTRSVIPHPYAFNLFLHNSPLVETGYAEEEIKMLQETHKILQDDSIGISATCVRVPVLRSHSESINAEFHSPLSRERAEDLLKNSPGITLLEDRKENRFPMPVDATGKDSVFCGRIREDKSQPNTLDLWVVGDQLLKGAALNAVQIAEYLLPVTR
jgi:aspartate-semialdehyde dehydrogenase